MIYESDVTVRGFRDSHLLTGETLELDLSTVLVCLKCMELKTTETVADVQLGLCEGETVTKIEGCHYKVIMERGHVDKSSFGRD